MDFSLIYSVHWRFTISQFLPKHKYLDYDMIKVEQPIKCYNHCGEDASRSFTDKVQKHCEYQQVAKAVLIAHFSHIDQRKPIRQDLQTIILQRLMLIEWSSFRKELKTVWHNVAINTLQLPIFSQANQKGLISIKCNYRYAICRKRTQELLRLGSSQKLLTTS